MLAARSISEEFSSGDARHRDSDEMTTPHTQHTQHQSGKEKARDKERDERDEGELSLSSSKMSYSAPEVDLVLPMSVFGVAEAKCPVQRLKLT